MSKLRADFLPTLRASWLVWTPVQLVNLSLIPLKFRYVCARGTRPARSHSLSHQQLLQRSLRHRHRLPLVRRAAAAARASPAYSQEYPAARLSLRETGPSICPSVCFGTKASSTACTTSSCYVHMSALLESRSPAPPQTP